ncbi:MAG: VOC family protein [Propionicimonas sp.]|uniref:VOC family protein n=1 Tax=Propionicimonas sp. TaxID=1955623 RepID=UPI002B1F0F8F|nr:VOC family protein [Propionicimonas sp.]MEA4945141.1 VOC family protein [Propionicimonas sp.]MEA5053490.1 VOC family protein [Propionicimonas sp.]MEA5118194.1 VOC family protein [Propionicimonas sp.]
MTGITIQEVVLDCTDPAALAAFWGRLLECGWGSLDDNWAVVHASPLMGFQRVPEAKSSPKNRLHLDIQVDDITAAIERAEALGAHTLGDPNFGTEGGFQVMLDPEDNEFCLVSDPAGTWHRALLASITNLP